MFISLFVAILSTRLTDALILRSVAAKTEARDKQYLSAALNASVETNSTELAISALQTSASESVDSDFYLSEAGYQAIAALHSDDAMAAFSRVLLAKEGKMVSDEGELSGLVPWFSGTSAVQTLDLLKTELMAKTWVLPDIVQSEEQTIAKPWTSPVTEEELKKLPGLTPADLQATEEEGEQLYASRKNYTKAWTSPVTEEELSKLPALTPADIQAAALDTSVQENKTEMAGFEAPISAIRLRTLANTSDTADDDVSAVGNTTQLVAEHVPMDLATLGREAMLTEEGFQSVAKTGSRVAMDAFVRKVLAAKAWRVTDETFMANVLPWYTGECANQSYDALLSELHSSRKAHSCHPSWIGNKYGKHDKDANRSYLHPATSRNLDQAAFSLIRGMIAQTGASSVPGTRERMWTFVRSLLKRNGSWEEIEALSAKNNTGKWLQFKNKLNYSKGAIKVAGGARDWLKNVGAYAPLNEDGYKAVVDVRNDTQMQMFVRRVARNESLNITDENGLSGFSMYYSGFCAEQSYAALVKEVATLMASHYVTNINYDVSVDWMPTMFMLRKRIAKTAGVDRSQVKIEVLDIPEPTGSKLSSELVAQKVEASLSVSYEMLGKGSCSSEEKTDGSRMGDWIYGQSMVDAEKACEAGLKEDLRECTGFHWNVVDASYVLVSKVGPKLGNDTDKGELCYKKPVDKQVEEFVEKKFANSSESQKEAMSGTDMKISANQSMKFSTNQSMNISVNQMGMPAGPISLLEVASTRRSSSHTDQKIQKRLVISVTSDSLDHSKRVEAALLQKIFVKNGQIEMQAAPSTLFVQGSTKPPQCGGGLAKKRFFEV